MIKRGVLLEELQDPRTLSEVAQISLLPRHAAKRHLFMEGVGVCFLDEGGRWLAG